MGRILAFLIAYRNSLLFVLLEVAALSVVFRFQSYQRSVFLNNANTIGASIHATQTKWRDYFSLEDINQKLVEQNVALLRDRNDTLYTISNDSTGWFAKLNLEKFDVYSARIIFNTTNRPINTFVIDKGSNHGLSKGLGVSTSKGIAGKIIEVNNSYSLCLSILNIKSPVVMPKSAELSNKSGTMEWKGLDKRYVKLKGIHKFENVKKGYHVVSSGYSINFPENIPVGRIAEVKKNNQSFYDIRVQLAADLSRDRFVYIFSHKNQGAIDSLIQQADNLQ